MKIKVCKYCGCIDDGIIPFVKDERKCVSCRNSLKRERYKSDDVWRQNLYSKMKEYRNSPENKEKQSEYIRRYSKDNSDKIKSHKRKYVINNKDKVNMITSKRRSSKLNRTPKWLTKSDFSIIKMYYSLADRLTRCLGISFHVDHIIPLQGKLVSGLHTPSNLQVIPSSINFKKNNNYHI